MAIVRYNPFRDIERIENDLDRIWGAAPRQLTTLTEAGSLDIYEENGNLIAEVTLPKFKKNEVQVNTEQGILEISAEHKEKQEDKSKRQYYVRESSNQYLRRVALPEGVNADKSEASFKDGVLKITMPYAKPKKPKAISVK